MSTPAAPQVVVLGGGLGSRIESVAGGRPKALVPILGEPFAHHQMRLLASQGIREIVYVIGFRGDQIRREVGDREKGKLSVPRQNLPCRILHVRR